MAIGIYMVVDVCGSLFVVHGICSTWYVVIVIGVTGGLALPSDEARLAETPLESPGLCLSLRRRRGCCSRRYGYLLRRISDTYCADDADACGNGGYHGIYMTMEAKTTLHAWGALAQVYYRKNWRVRPRGI